MRIGEEVNAQLVARFAMVLPLMDKRQRRLVLGAKARLLGCGGVAAVADAAGVSVTTVRRGLRDFDQVTQGEVVLPARRCRRPVGGRHQATARDLGLLKAMLATVEPDERGAPMSPLHWTTKSLRHLARQLTAAGHHIIASTVRPLLHEAEFKLQGSCASLEGAQHPDRDAPFAYIKAVAKDNQDDGSPVSSVDAKNEYLGQLPAAGQEWRPDGDPVLDLQQLTRTVRMIYTTSGDVPRPVNSCRTAVYTTGQMPPRRV